MTPFRLKRALLSPYVWYMRRRFASAPEFGRSLLEAQYYRPTMFRWLRRFQATPDLLHDAPLGPDGVVFDVGGYTGEWAGRIVELHDPRVFVFEPNPACFAALDERFRDRKKVRCLRYGLHDSDATLPLGQEGWGSSIFPEGVRENAPRATVSVRDAARVFEEIAPGGVDLLKLNIEGAEYEVLDRLLETGWMTNVRILLVQFHEWRAGAYGRRRAIRRRLAKTHSLEWDYPFIWEKWVRR
ncbi:MAG TPA: FkbM family methyltransferase [Polyangiaceae bacterium]|nr:FkbM family methyltransferase [Polyangiaceae bacterium]